MSGYIGRTPLSEAIQSRAKYIATTGQTVFSFKYQPGFVDVYLNGVKLQNITDYTSTSGTSIVLTSGAILGQVLQCVGLSTFSLNNGKINYAGTTAPLISNDSSEGYRVGSMWIDVTNDKAYICVDDSTGAAVWNVTTYSKPSSEPISYISGLQSALDTKTTPAYVDNKVADLVASAPATLDTLNELAAALGDDANHATTMTNLVATKQSASGDYDVGDNVKIKLGDSDDLQIWHDSLNSVIKNTTGTLFLRSDSVIHLQDAGGNESFASFNDNGSVKLYHDNSKKFATTSSGVDITGALSVNDLLNVQSTTNYARIEVGGPSGGYIDFKTPFSDDYDGRLKVTNTGVTLTSAGSIPVKLAVGNQVKLEASGGGVAITGALAVSGDVTADGLHITTNTATTKSDLSFTDNAVIGVESSLSIAMEGSSYFRIMSGATSNTTGTAGATERARFTSTGNVGIGTSSPLGKIHSKEGTSGVTSISSNFDQLVLEDDLHSGMHILSGASQDGAIYFGSTNGSSQGQLKYFQASDSFSIYTNDQERLKISSTGNVGIGTSSPRRHLHIHNPASATVGFQMTNGVTGETNDSQGFQIKVGSDGHAEIAQMENSDLRVFTNASERMRITSTGNVGIGATDDIDSRLHVKTSNAASTLKLERREVDGILVDGDGIGSILFESNDDTTGASGVRAQIDAIIQDSSGAAYLKFSTASTGSTVSEAMRIIGNGNVGIGTSSPSSKLTVESSGSTNIVAKSTNGNGGYYNYQGLSSSGSQTFAVNHNGSIYTSSAIYLNGDTAAANALDDYEEGTWTPTINDSSTASNEGQVYAHNAGYFTKIGDVVHCWGKINITSLGSMTTSGSTHIHGLPFNANPATYFRPQMLVGYGSSLNFTAGNSLTGFGPNNQSYMRVANWDAGTGYSALKISELSVSANIHFYIIYKV